MCLLQAANITETYNATRQEGLNAEVKRRILMGTYALSAGYYDAYYKRAQQVQATTSDYVLRRSHAYSNKAGFSGPCLAVCSAVEGL